VIPLVGFEAGHHGQDEGTDADDGQEEHPDANEGQAEANQEGDGDGDLEVEGFFGFRADEIGLVFFDEPNDQGAEEGEAADE